MRRKISIFGSTGSIGQQTVDLIDRQGGAENFEVIALSGASNIALLAEQARKLRAKIAVTAEETREAELRAALSGTGIKVLSGASGIAQAAAEPADWTMSAIVGAAGLEPTLIAAQHGGTLALANKESLVCAGRLLKAVCAKHQTTLIPADSEHSAIFQAMRGENAHEVDRLILTASGGPFRDWTQEKMASATLEQASKHPNWEMGQRITIDSASMFNKAMEMIEAHELFEINPSSIEVIIHQQSIVHSMVGFIDGALIAQLGPADMRGAIGFALNWPERTELPVERLDFAKLARLDFHAVDHARFPAVGLAVQAMETGGLAGAVFNAAKECALDGFIGEKIGFLDMATLVANMLESKRKLAKSFGDTYTLQDVLTVDAQTRDAARRWISAQ